MSKKFNPVWNIKTLTITAIAAIATTIVTAQSTYHDWIETVAPGATSKEQEPLADPNLDGLSNLLTYVVGGHPFDSMAPRVVSIGNSAAGPQFRLRVRSSDSDIQYKLGFSSDLQAWQWHSLEFDGSNWTLGGTGPALVHTSELSQDIWEITVEDDGAINPLMAVLEADHFITAALDAKLVLVESGTFLMTDEVTTFNTFQWEIIYTTRETTVSSFYIGTHEITVAQWNLVRDWGNANGYDISTHPAGCLDTYPVDDMSRPDIHKWCNALNEMEGLDPVYYTDATQTTVYKTGSSELTNSCVDWKSNGYRLPTEAEWEFAARGGVRSRGYIHSGGNIGSEVAWSWENASGSDCPPDWVVDQGGTEGPHPAGLLLPNELGIYDMSGNVHEYCWDFHDYLGTEPVVDPRGPEADTGNGRVMRGGGSWVSSLRPLFDGVDRWSLSPAVNHQNGFRLARNTHP